MPGKKNSDVALDLLKREGERGGKLKRFQRVLQQCEKQDSTCWGFWVISLACVVGPYRHDAISRV
jgi:hypothetical protein